ncbi:histidine phosphatase family protein [Falsiroseomonas sp. HW251]|uniref:histidine phosphatase family protein n=1 Tax=Falsiroseomonas sp. HW251 TaxID=3390998 RepID=UPI003D31CFD3
MHRRHLLLAAPFLATRAQAQGHLLVAALRAGDVVVVMRHGITDRSQVDNGDLPRREGQRNLSDAGRAQSIRTGRAVAALAIPLGEVLASPVFRARDTAELAFGARARIEPMLTADDYTPDPALLRRRIAWLAVRSGRPSYAGATDILVGHVVPLGMMLGRPLAQEEFPEGGMAVFAPGGTGRFLGVLDARTLWVVAAA